MSLVCGLAIFVELVIMSTFAMNWLYTSSNQHLHTVCRGTNVHMLQEVANMQQNAGLSLQSLAGNVQSSTSVALQQQQLQQLLCQQQAKRQFSATGIKKQSSSSSARRPAFGSWPWQRATTPDFSSRFSASHREPSSLNMQSDQQLCPQLDGTFLADVIKASSAPASLPLHSLSQPIIASRSFSASSTRTPLGSAFHMGLKGNQEPSQNVSPTTSFQTLPSNSSILTVKPDVELPVGLCAADTHLDSSFGEHTVCLSQTVVLLAPCHFPHDAHLATQEGILVCDDSIQEDISSRTNLATRWSRSCLHLI
jgi:hypothetical protein